MSLSGFFWHFIRPKKWVFALMFLLTLMAAFGDAFTPFLLRVIIDRVVAFTGPRSDVFGAVFWPLVLFLGVWIILEAAIRIQLYISLKTVLPMKAKMRGEMFAYLQKHSHSFFQDQLAGNLSNKVLDMVRGFESIINILFRSFIPVLFFVLFSLSFLFYIHPIFALIVFIWLICFWGIFLYFMGGCIEKADEHSEANSQLSGRIVDAFKNMATIRLFARQRYEMEYLAKFQNQEVKKGQNLNLYLIMVTAIQSGLSIILLFAIVVAFIYAWQREWVTVGDFTYLTTSTLQLTMWVWWTSDQFIDFMKEFGVCRQALSVINIPHEIKDAPDSKPLRVEKGKIEFRNVTFHYKPKKNIFRDKNILILPGEKVGLVGYSGSGKSTFVNLILRYFDLEKGQILIDDHDIAKLSQDSLREQITFVPQDTMLFHRTLKENVRYGKIDATDEEIVEACKKARCQDFIMDLEKQYDTLVGEGGIKLSGGQRQRIAIARAFLKNSPILIMDEATSSLDSATERSIQESLYELMKDKTTLVVAHRLSTLAEMDRILVFDKGQIIESGTHQELLKLNGHYAHLWKKQTDGFLPEK